MRYFMEVAYKGTGFAGFQVQENALTIQGAVEKAMKTVMRRDITLTGSSRTDAGVHALQNYFHFDAPDFEVDQAQLYNINAVLDRNIVVRQVFPVEDSLHARFSAVYRRYEYHITRRRDPFLQDTAWFYPFKVDTRVLQEVAHQLLDVSDFSSFSKRNTQVKTMICNLSESYWVLEKDRWIYTVQGNRFLRGMVRGLVGTMLQVGRGKLSKEDFARVVEAKDCTQADFSTPAHGLFLVKVGFEPVLPSA